MTPFFLVFPRDVQFERHFQLTGRFLCCCWISEQNGVLRCEGFCTLTVKYTIRMWFLLTNGPINCWWSFVLLFII